VVARLKTDLKVYMRAGEKQKTAVVKSLLSDLTYAAKSAQGMSDGPIDVLQKALKRRLDSVDAYKSGGREELVTQELEEAAIIQEYLPKQMTDAELETVVRGVVGKLGATSVKELGKVIKGVVGEIEAGSATKKAVSEVVKRVLMGL
ncbi:Yqey-like protein-domain-containing protein, partial [Chytridium lagenaria]